MRTIPTFSSNPVHMLRNNWQPWSYPILIIGPRNSTPFTRQSFTRKHTWSLYKPTKPRSNCTGASTISNIAQALQVVREMMQKSLFWTKVKAPSAFFLANRLIWSPQHWRKQIFKGSLPAPHPPHIQWQRIDRLYRKPSLCVWEIIIKHTLSGQNM